MSHRQVCIALLFPLFLTAQESAGLLTKSYVIGQVPILHDHIGTGGSGGGAFGDLFSTGTISPTPSKESNLPWARKTAHPKFLEEYVSHHTGVTFPKGTWIRYQRGGHVLHMRNTPVNHELLQLGLVRSRLLASQVTITMRLLAFPEKELDVIERQAAGPLTDADWIQLWKEGKGNTLAVSSMKTGDGINAIIECVEEMIYPTELDLVEEKLTPEGSDGLVYGGFETREVGAILNVTPTVSEDWNTLHLVILPEKAVAKGANPDQPESAKPMTPVFHSMNLTSTLVIENGQTLVAGQSTDAATGQRWVMLIHARLTTSQGKPVATPLVIPPAMGLEEDQ